MPRGVALAATGAALHPALRREPAPVSRGTTVLLVCTGNSVRSPIAEALLRHHAAGRAGTHPKPNSTRTPNACCARSASTSPANAPATSTR